MVNIRYLCTSILATHQVNKNFDPSIVDHRILGLNLSHLVPLQPLYAKATVVPSN